MALLNISQVNADTSEAVDVCLLEVSDGTYNQIQRMPFQFRKAEEVWQAWDVVIDLMDDEQNLIADVAVVIPPHSAAWLLGEFFSLPKKIVKKIKHQDRDFRR